MKMTKSLFLAFAGLGLFACSNEDVVENGANTIDGPADVAVKINLPDLIGGRSVADDVTKEEAVSVNTISVELEATLGSATKTEVEADGVYTFEGVEGPKKITVKINGGAVATTFADLNKVSVAGTAMNGETTTFTAEGNKYTAEVDMAHTMARLEFEGIHHKGHSGTEACRFKSGNLSGVMLNNVKLSSTATTAKVYTETEIDDIFKVGNTDELWDEVVNGTFFPAASANFPVDANGSDEKSPCYAYNIYPAAGAANLPKFTLYFTGLEGNTETYVGDNGFAFVEKYKISATGADAAVVEALCGEDATAADGFYQVINFPAGYVYKVENLEVKDGDVHTTPDGEGLTLEATINVTPWKVVAGSVDWN